MAAASPAFLVTSTKTAVKTKLHTARCATPSKGFTLESWCQYMTNTPQIKKEKKAVINANVFLSIKAKTCLKLNNIRVEIL